MKNLRILLKAAILALLVIYSVLPANAQTAPIRIMPLGDSITDGSSFDSPDGTGGYRGPLYNSLTSAGYNVDYIGSLTINSAQLVEKEHEGHSGWRIDQLDSNIAGWLGVMADPDVVLMHIGTNDFGQNFNINTAIDRLDALILKIATLRPYCHIIVSNLMERAGTAETNIQALFNPFVQARVNAHATAGRRVYFLDMRAAVPLSDMPDNLHPDQNGYNKMAAAWLPAIQAVIAPDGDSAPPAIYRAVGNSNLAEVSITFSKPVADSAASPANFNISGGLTVTTATLDASKRTVTLATSAQVKDTAYTITVNGIVDRTATSNPLPANSTANFFGATQRGYLNNVPESTRYTLVQSLDIPTTASYGTIGPAYAIDNSANIGQFTRVAYYIELQQTNGNLQYVWASMDAFTSNVNQLGVPTLRSGAIFQQNVANMNVISNAPGIVNGSGLSGNIEFWPTNYTAINGQPVAGASDTAFDFGDTRNTAGSYGTMQIHNASASQTVFAFNNWGGNGTLSNADLGIGNGTGPNTDWTFANNAGNYTVKSMQILVQTSGDTSAPTLVAAKSSAGLAQVVVTFSEPVSPVSLSSQNFLLNNGVEVLGYSLGSNQRDVVLTTSLQPSGTPLTLTVSGVRDTSPNANRIAANSTIAVSAPALPSEIITNVGAAANGYQLVYSLDIPATGNLNALGNSAYSFDDSSAIGAFSRVAYYLEIQKPGGPVQYVWTSMDAFTSSRKKIGVPTVASGAIFQRDVANMEVRSNVAGVVNGTTATGGNIEFWPNDYSVPNAVSVPNASATTYDTGDTRTTSGGNNYGCMQVHNHDAAANQTVFAFNRFGADGNAIDLGIGNNPAPVNNGVDWTFSSNAATYSKRVLHIMVLPAATTPTSIAANVPEAANYKVVYSLNIPTSGNLVSGAGFTDYAEDNAVAFGNFSRIGYYMELQKTGDAVPRFVWVSMDAFTQSAARTGIPTAASGAIFQQTITNMNVVSNVAGVVNGTGISTGNIEFWPTNYAVGRTLGLLPGDAGSETGFDFNDTRSTSGSHGSFQIHNYGASQTLLALSNWGTAGNAANVLAMGIGNNPTSGQHADYTLSANGTSWNLRRVLQVYVLPSGPTIASAVGSMSLDRLVVSFSVPVSDGSANPANFAIPGLTVTSATLLPGNRDVALTTSQQTPGASYSVAVTNVKDRSAFAPPIAPGATTTFTALTPPALIGTIPEAAGYEVIYRLAIPSASPRWNINPIPYAINEAQYGERQFDRVAYVLELDGNWVFSSFDRHTNQISKIGVPTLAVSSTPFQRLVTNMTVASNVSGIVTGTGIPTGNIEFWGGNYSNANAIAIPNASAAIYDFGDAMTPGTHGSMQIHNHGASQVIMAYNNWGTNAGQTSDTGIGNHPSPSATNSGAQLDWTFSNSAAASTVRNLYVLARPGGTPTGTAPTIISQPYERRVNPGAPVTFGVHALGAASYQWRKNGTPISGGIYPWLEIPAATLSDVAAYDVVISGPTLVATTSSTAALSLNTPPTFGGYTVVTPKNTVATIAVASILTAATDAENSAITSNAAGPLSSSGGIVSLAGGNVTYTPPANFVGCDTFAITIADDMGLTGSGLVTVFVSQDGQLPVSPSVTFQQNGSIAGLFIGVVGQSYQVQRSPDLVSWTVLKTAFPASDGTIPLYDPAPLNGKAFYRIKEGQ